MKVFIGLIKLIIVLRITQFLWKVIRVINHYETN